MVGEALSMHGDVMWWDTGRRVRAEGAAEKGVWWEGETLV